MQFKHPELLWALFLLLIPIIIHLFQLRRFQKTPFTNVKLLKKVVVESRRSSSLKKWLLLLTRLLLFATLIIAFAQPFFASKNALKEKETVIYLDDSFSMQLSDNGSNLLQSSVQDLLKTLSKDEVVSVFTNRRTFSNSSIAELQNDLLSLDTGNKQLKLSEVLLKGKTLFSKNISTDKHLVVISDFEEGLGSASNDSMASHQNHFVKVASENAQNISIDSAFLVSANDERLELKVSLSANYDVENIPISLFNGDTLVAKSASKLENGQLSTAKFTIPNNKTFKGKIEIKDSGLLYDNTLFFTIEKTPKIKVLAIGTNEADYLKRIYTSDKFEFTSTSLKQVNYGTLEDQNLIILNELQTLPSPLITGLQEFAKTGGSIAIIPSKNIDYDSYNALGAVFYQTHFSNYTEQELSITDIHFVHPLYQNVFEKNVTNFQYPTTKTNYTLKSNAPNILSYQNRSPFLSGKNNFYSFSAPLSISNSNFKGSPLIVPTFYNMAVNSLKTSDLYHSIGSPIDFDVPLSLSQDQVLKIVNSEEQLIPRQQSFGSKVRLSFGEEMRKDGIYTIMNGQQVSGLIAFNYARTESQLNYLNPEQLEGATISESIPVLFSSLEKDRRVEELWKWFVILALSLLLIEILIQKLL